MNKVILKGNVVADADIKTFDDGGKVASYKLAVQRPYKNKDGINESDFIFCSASGKRAEFAEKYCVKGQAMIVVGALRVRSWQDENKTWHNITDVNVLEHYFAGASKSKNKAPDLPETGGTQTATDDDDELPF